MQADNYHTFLLSPSPLTSPVDFSTLGLQPDFFHVANEPEADGLFYNWGKFEDNRGILREGNRVRIGGVEGTVMLLNSEHLGGIYPLLQNLPANVRTCLDNFSELNDDERAAIQNKIDIALRLHQRAYEVRLVEVARWAKTINYFVGSNLGKKAIDTIISLTDPHLKKKGIHIDKLWGSLSSEEQDKIKGGLVITTASVGISLFEIFESVKRAVDLPKELEEIGKPMARKILAAVRNIQNGNDFVVSHIATLMDLQSSDPARANLTLKVIVSSIKLLKKQVERLYKDVIPQVQERLNMYLSTVKAHNEKEKEKAMSNILQGVGELIFAGIQLDLEKLLKDGVKALSTFEKLNVGMALIRAGGQFSAAGVAMVTWASLHRIEKRVTSYLGLYDEIVEMLENYDQGTLTEALNSSGVLEMLFFGPLFTTASTELQAVQRKLQEIIAN
eukprot:CAMPEP_0174251214 /NCGR_PEP_ID=MMETSP0439-20130205/1111_1 /TAXON_ID=0 /ORGANISM="Stereomyxa ramosa, Strain Chinc5" /LENGTH=444 /DNA_ID=CAMNT_0015331477 /DNA_START=17 /DNA_END=1351 /DNA_ORIENTATION=+